LILLLILLILSLTADAYAYVDPGIGGTIYQIIILVIGGVGVLLVTFKNKLFRIFRKNKKT
jgi:hypothetical protein